MKRLFACIIISIFCSGCFVYAEQPPDEYTNRQVTISISSTEIYFGDVVILTAVLHGYPPEPNVIYQWQVSNDEMNWLDLSGENDKHFSLEVTEDNYQKYYRVVVSWIID